MAGARGPRFWTIILVVIILSGAAVYAMFSSGLVANILNLSNQSTTSNSPNAREGLSFGQFYVISGTNTTQQIQNIGTVAVGLTTYIVEDNRSDVYTFHYTSQLVINPGSSLTLSILIGSSCGGCVLSGNPFTYTYYDRVILVTARNNQFTFAV